jgi:hypothetical protein
MANVEAARQIRLSRAHVLGLAVVLTFVAGTLFSTAALAAGIDSPDTLALVFALGGSTMLFLLLVWYTIQLGRAAGEGEPRVHSRPPLPAPFDRGPAWLQARRPPSGTTIMWAASAFRRRTDIASPRG